MRSTDLTREKEFLNKEVADLTTKVYKAEAPRDNASIEKASAEEANLWLIIKKAECEKENAITNTALERTMAVYKKTPLMGLVVGQLHQVESLYCRPVCQAGG